MFYGVPGVPTWSYHFAAAMISLINVMLIWVRCEQTYQVVGWHESCTGVPYSTDQNQQFTFCEEGLLCASYPYGIFPVCHNCSRDLEAVGINYCSACEIRMNGGTTSWIECVKCEEGYEPIWRVERGRNECVSGVISTSPTMSPTASSSASPTATATANPTANPTQTPTATATPSASSSASPTANRTAIPSSIWIPTAIQSEVALMAAYLSLSIVVVLLLLFIVCSITSVVHCAVGSVG